ncbi:DUF2510 domain-containing protein [Herbiconiux liukaitaii]|uniref:DUF2510 domain-containing protein n=1 Tax=Herbiconiux liukaitaii TaxID=3342799 RepID=UPI0035B6C835
MTDPQSPRPAAGWYPEQGQASERYWDGSAWTEQRRPLASAQQSQPPVPPMQPAYQAQQPYQQPGYQQPQQQHPGYGQQPYQPQGQPPAQPPKAGTGLATTALILGIVSIVMAFIPAVSVFAVVVALAGVIIGIIALIKKGPAKTRALIGTILSGLAFILAIVMTFVYAFLLAGAAITSIDDAISSYTPEPVPVLPTEAPSIEPSPETSTEPSPGGEELQIGVPIELVQSGGVAQITILRATYGPTTGSDFDIPASNGGYLILDVLWETSEGVTSSNPFYFDAKDANGVQGGYAIALQTPLGSGDVPVGDRSTGQVGYDIGPGPYTVTILDELLQEQARLTVEATPR